MKNIPVKWMVSVWKTKTINWITINGEDISTNEILKFIISNGPMI